MNLSIYPSIHVFASSLLMPSSSSSSHVVSMRVCLFSAPVCLGVDEGSLSVALLLDGVFEQASVAYERIVVKLSSPSGALIDTNGGGASAYLTIRDLDAENLTLGWCLTDLPSWAPTAIY